MTRRVIIVAFPDAELLDISGPASVFANAGRDHYSVSIAASRKGPVATSSGIEVNASHALARAPRSIDTLLIAGGTGTRAACEDPLFIAGVARLARRAKRIAAVCTGAFVLAQAGLLDGRRATTHWRYAALLQSMYPRIAVESDAIFVHDHSCWTSAGVCAGIDLALALVEADLGRTVALSVARELVVFLQRSGGQSQFSVPLATQASQLPLIERVRQLVLDRPQARWSVETLAQRAHVSPRHLRRLFVREVAMGPREFVTRIRLEQAQRLLSVTSANLTEVARRCGYGSAESLGKRFHARFGVTPRAWQERFYLH